MSILREENNVKRKIMSSEFGLNKELSAWEKVNLVKRMDRPTTYDYIDKIFDNFIELHGDRRFSDDNAIIGGIGYLNDIPVTVIGHQKGRNTKENIDRNFGMANPEGYRKALRLMNQAEKFNRPIVCFIDTPGAFCGIGAEERGQGNAIAENLMEMSTLKTVIIAIFIGEGGSGGALGLGVADEIWMLEHSVFSIISPQGFASILWKDACRAEEAAEVMKITAQELKKFGIIDKVIEEPKGGANEDCNKIKDIIKLNLTDKIIELMRINKLSLVKKRYDKFRAMGMFEEY